MKSTLTLGCLLLCLLHPRAGAENIEPFTTDGCSAFPDGTVQQQSLWVGCCIQHDLAYWRGGTYEQRERADADLEQCVSELGEEEISKLMHAGVRVGGSPYFPTPYRWGYGWPYPRGYKALSEEELTAVRRQLKLMTVMLQTIEAELADAPPEPSEKPEPPEK